MKQRIECEWNGDMSFKANIDDHILIMDADEANGGHNKGPGPKVLTLASLAGCTAMDVIFFLRKMRIVPEYFNVVAEGELTNEHPKYYHKIHLIYELRGENLNLEKIKNAVALSHEKYCGVSALLRKGAEITSEIKILD